MKVRKEELLRLLSRLDRGWIVSSTPFGCVEGYSKIYLKRKRANWTLKVRLPMSECLPNEEVKELKEQIRRQLRKVK